MGSKTNNAVKFAFGYHMLQKLIFTSCIKRQPALQGFYSTVSNVTIPAIPLQSFGVTLACQPHKFGKAGY